MPWNTACCRETATARPGASPLRSSRSPDAMEHSLLHGVQLCGLVFALGGLLFRWVVLAPALRIAGGNSAGQGIDALLDRWIFRAALAALLGTVIDFFVQI